jgi:hypothetical protein
VQLERTADARRQVPEAARTIPCATFWPEEKQQLEARIAALERQNSGLKAKVAELVAAQKTKNFNTVAPRNETKADVQQGVSCRRVRVVTAAVADERGHSTLRREQLTDGDLG